MTFDLTPPQAAAQTRARELAPTLTRAAAEIDRTGALPAEVSEPLEGLGLTELDRFTRTLVIEELAAASGSAAALLVLGHDGGASGLAGLRGVPAISAPSDQQYLDVAAVCLGLGRAALHEALATARARGDRPGGEPGDPPHWALADAATELDAARLLVQASTAPAGFPAAAGLVQAASAAARVIDAAIRTIGVEGYAIGSRLERCARDARAAWLVIGGEDAARRTAADALFETAR